MLKSLFKWIPSLSQNSKVTCEDSCAETKQKNRVRYRKRLSNWTMYSDKWYNFWIKSPKMDCFPPSSSRIIWIYLRKTLNFLDFFEPLLVTTFANVLVIRWLEASVNQENERPLKLFGNWCIGRGLGFHPSRNQFSSIGENWSSWIRVSNVVTPRTVLSVKILSGYQPFVETFPISGAREPA